MNRIYRGQSYTPSHTVAEVNPNIFLCYRGQSYQRSTAVAVTSPSKLTYRGVPYLQVESSTIPSFTPAFN